MSLEYQDLINVPNKAVTVVFEDLIQGFQKQGIVFTPNYFARIIGMAEHGNACPTCYQAWLIPANEGNVPVVNAKVSYPTCDAFRTATAPYVDHTHPVAVCDALTEGLIYMAPEHKITLRKLLSTQVGLSLNREIWAALNLGEHHIAVRNHGSAYTPPLVTNWDDDEGLHTRYRALSADRWYAICWGEGFSGVACGLREFESLVVGKTNARGKASNTRAKAEYLYLLSLYDFDCGVVESSQRIPASCDHIPL